MIIADDTGSMFSSYGKIFVSDSVNELFCFFNFLGVYSSNLTRMRPLACSFFIITTIFISFLFSVPTKQYQISTTTNKVYDITDRKKFCSTKCFKASEYIKSQMLTSPLWLRHQEIIPEFKLLKLND